MTVQNDAEINPLERLAAFHEAEEYKRSILDSDARDADVNAQRGTEMYRVSFEIRELLKAQLEELRLIREALDRA